MRLRFHPNRKGGVQLFGPLETEIMKQVWQHEQVTVRQVHRALSRQREIAYTTVMTTMSRLAEKGILKRTRQGMAYLYRAAMSRAEFDRMVVNAVLSGLLETFDQAAVDSFVEYLAHERPEQLELLRRSLASKTV
ncbi:MAG: BlaI/MecI/CopY family transcriptional regulator [Chloroflexia bacterium]